MLKACPISFQKVDETSVRMHAAFICILGLIFIVNDNIVWLAILLYDFIVRIIGYPRFSPLFLLSRSLVNVMSLQPHIVDAGPKQFAAKIGLIFIISAIVAYVNDYGYTAAYIIVILSICAFLEAVFAFCVGCEMYPLWRALFYSRSKDS
ncbi:DUF4395 domain-containing protein [bacterium]|nr:DUF4395 domain-containing protein [bacterium]MBU1883026.1 DUF4395 domain-containing protein [bacterium]